MASAKSLLTGLARRGPHRVLRGDLGFAGQPGIVYTPEAGLSLPAVVFAHGWLSGASNYKGLLEHLASWGFVTAAPDNERGIVPSHLGFATDLLTTIDICVSVRLGDGDISVNPAKVALAGHGMGAGAAVLAAGQRDVAAVACLFPAPTAPAAETAAPSLDAPGLVLASGSDSIDLNARQLATAWALPVTERGGLVFRTVNGAAPNGIAEGRRLATALGIGGYDKATAKAVRGLLTGYLLATVAGDEKYQEFADPAAEIPGTTAIDPNAPEPEPAKLSRRAQISQLLGR